MEIHGQQWLVRNSPLAEIFIFWGIYHLVYSIERLQVILFVHGSLINIRSNLMLLICKESHASLYKCTQKPTDLMFLFSVNENPKIRWIQFACCTFLLRSLGYVHLCMHTSLHKEELALFNWLIFSIKKGKYGKMSFLLWKKKYKQLCTQDDVQ